MAKEWLQKISTKSCSAMQPLLWNKHFHYRRCSSPPPVSCVPTLIGSLEKWDRPQGPSSIESNQRQGRKSSLNMSTWSNREQLVSPYSIDCLQIPHTNKKDWCLLKLIPKYFSEKNLSKNKFTFEIISWLSRYKISTHTPLKHGHSISKPVQATFKPVSDFNLSKKHC